VNISSNVTTIQNRAFECCPNLTSITIPSSVTSIGTSPFPGCVNLVSINVDANNALYTDIDGVLFDHNKTKLIQYPCGHSNTYTVPDNVTIIGEKSFFECSGLKSVTIPASVTSIEGSAFNTVNMAYINYLGLNEPSCEEYPGSIVSTFVRVEVVCVPMNYNSSRFCEVYHVKVPSCEEFVSQQNQCFEVLEWQAEEITVKKRANATLWEKKTDNCFEYQCSNTSGGIAWSKCNSTDDVHRLCINNKCVEEKDGLNKDKWGVEMSVNITPDELDMKNLIEVLNRVTGLSGNDILIGTEYEETTGAVVKIVIYVDDEDVARKIMIAIERIMVSCKKSIYGVLCRVSGVHILEKEEFSEFSLVTSKANNNHNNLLIMTNILIMVMIFIKMMMI